VNGLADLMKAAVGSCEQFIPDLGCHKHSSST